ncbi:MAG TPA: hypothetical protein VFH38_10040, partial [Jatrophihabitans sp.]|nr:hypothetical protein [Jatrophihabitans sp.]
MTERQPSGPVFDLPDESEVPAAGSLPGAPGDGRTDPHDGSAGRRRRGPGVVIALAVAAVTAVVVAVHHGSGAAAPMSAGARSGPRPPLPSAAARAAGARALAPLLGTTWVAGGTGRPSLTLAGDGTVEGNDGCRAFSAVLRPADASSFALDRLLLVGRGCADPPANARAARVDALFEGTVGWQADHGRLTLVAVGVTGAQAVRSALVLDRLRGPAAAPRDVDPAHVAGLLWRLVRTQDRERGRFVVRPARAVTSLLIAPNGDLTLTGPCTREEGRVRLGVGRLVVTGLRVTLAAGCSDASGPDGPGRDGPGRDESGAAAQARRLRTVLRGRVDWQVAGRE